MLRTRIIGTGHHLPERVVTNDDLSKVMDTNDEWIQQRTGIKTRHYADEGTGSSEIGVPAAQRALEDAGVEPDEIDCIVCTTVTPDHIFPSTGSLLQHKLGMKDTPAFDLNAACSGFIYGLTVADGLLRAGTFNTILMVAAERVSNRLSYNRRDTAVLFGDGAAAIVLRAEEGENGLLMTYQGSDGGSSEILMLEAGGSRTSITKDNVGGPDMEIQMDGKELYKRAVVAFGSSVEKALAETGMSGDDIDIFVPHQANMRIISHAASRIGLPEDKIFANIDHVGNTVAASIPIALDEARAQGRIQEGSVVLMAAFGAGLTWGSAMMRW
jgi:3-oxoacyl-[acyl-carrier-protein] synthase-3